MKSWFLSVFLILTILIISAVLYWRLTNSSSTASVPKDSGSLLNDIPPLFPQVSWEEFIETQENKLLGEYGLYSQGEIFGSIRMNGQEWTASKGNLDRGSMDKLLASFRSYYDNELTKLGWITYHEDGTYNFSPSAADGPGGSIWGYVKVKDGKIREVLLQNITPIEDFGGRAVCPCNVTFRVFVSEEVLLEELIKRVEEE